MHASYPALSTSHLCYFAPPSETKWKPTIAPVSFSPAAGKSAASAEMTLVVGVVLVAGLLGAVAYTYR